MSIEFHFNYDTIGVCVLNAQERQKDEKVQKISKRVFLLFYIRPGVYDAGGQRGIYFALCQCQYY